MSHPSLTVATTPVGRSVTISADRSAGWLDDAVTLASSATGETHVWCDHLLDDEIDELTRRLGPLVRRHRHLDHMVVSLPLAPDVVARVDLDDSNLDVLDPDRDLPEWRRVNNAAFAWHPEQRDRSLSDLTEALRQPWVDLDDFLVHRRGEGLDAFCWTRYAPADPDMEPHGEIYVIGVDPAAHGRGLGRLVTTAGLVHQHRAHGVTTGALWVEADNDAGVGLYTSMGFRLHRRRHAVVTSVSSGPAR